MNSKQVYDDQTFEQGNTKKTDIFGYKTEDGPEENETIEKP